VGDPRPGAGPEGAPRNVGVGGAEFFEPRGYSKAVRPDLLADREEAGGGSTCALRQRVPPRADGAAPGLEGALSMEEIHRQFLAVAERTKGYDFIEEQDGEAPAAASRRGATGRGRPIPRSGAPRNPPPLPPAAAAAVLRSAEDAKPIDVDASPVPEVEGFVHSIESLSAVDGPGLRFVVFTQGCAYRCQFCCNPDSWEIGAGTRTTSKEVARQIARAVPYLKHGKGGVTASGGDPMLQPDFVAAIFKECRRMGLPTAIDTTGMGNRGLWRKLLPHTDLIMLCVKAPKKATYARLTGGFQQDPMLRFSAAADQMGIPMWIRYVLIPGMTDGDFDVAWLAQFCKDHRCVQQIDVLPYHTLGVHKWEAMGLRYPLEGQRSPTRAEVRGFMDRLHAEMGGLGVSVIATGVD